MTSIALFSNRSGIGATTLLHHLAHALAAEGKRLVVADLDPQCSATRMFLAEEDWQSRASFGSGELLSSSHLIPLGDGLAIAAGSPALAVLELEPSDATLLPLRLTEAICQHKAFGADFVLADVQPSLGPLSLASVAACRHWILPLSPDPASKPFLDVLGAAHRAGRISRPLGCVMVEGAAQPGWATGSLSRRKVEVVEWAALAFGLDTRAAADQFLLGEIKHYPGLMQMARGARKPVFELRAADGVMGAHHSAVQESKASFVRLAKTVIKRTQTEP